MKCFIHHDSEAIAACRKCGKGMCSTCSAYSNHSGICPECRRDEFIKKRDQIEKQINYKKHDLGWYIFKSIIFVWTIIYPIYGIYKIVTLNNAIKEAEAQSEKYTIEILKLGKALKQGVGIAI